MEWTPEQLIVANDRYRNKQHLSTFQKRLIYLHYENSVTSPCSYVEFFHDYPDEDVDMVNHPAHYGGKDNPYEACKVIEAWGLDWHLGSAVKYISRAGKKDPAKEKEDIEKAIWYLQRKVSLL